jgi:predicted Abi (CAAX) family protease
LRELRHIFWRPTYLAVVALLGLVCTFLYLKTGSVWPPVLVHGITVALWKLFFGGPGRLPSIIRKWPIFHKNSSAER